MWFREWSVAEQLAARLSIEIVRVLNRIKNGWRLPSPAMKHVDAAQSIPAFHLPVWCQHRAAACAECSSHAHIVPGLMRPDAGKRSCARSRTAKRCRVSCGRSDARPHLFALEQSMRARIDLFSTTSAGVPIALAQQNRRAIEFVNRRARNLPAAVIRLSINCTPGPRG